MCISSVDTTALTKQHTKRSNNRRPVIPSAKVRSNGAPIVSLSSGNAYTYDKDLSAWTELSSSWWSRGSEFWETAGRVRGTTAAAGRGPVKLLESETTDWISAANTAEKGKVKDRLSAEDDSDDTDVEMIEGDADGDAEKVGNDDDWKTALSLGHLESRLQSASVLGSLPEYRSFLGLYAKKLGEEAFKGKAEELCKELIGPIYQYVATMDGSSQRLMGGRCSKSSRDILWESHVLGTHKHVLLKEVLNIFSKTKNLSRLNTEYSELLKRIASD